MCYSMLEIPYSAFRIVQQVGDIGIATLVDEYQHTQSYFPLAEVIQNAQFVSQKIKMPVGKVAQAFVVLPADSVFPFFCVSYDAASVLDIVDYLLSV